LEAAYEGSWGENRRISIDSDVSDQAAAMLGPALVKADLFNLRVTEVAPDGSVVQTETFRNLTFKESTRRFDKVLLAESNLVRWTGSATPGSVPATTLTFLSNRQTKITEVQAAETADATASTTATKATLATKRGELADLSADAVSRSEQKLADAKNVQKNTPSAAADAAVATAIAAV